MKKIISISIFACIVCTSFKTNLSLKRNVGNELISVKHFVMTDYRDTYTGTYSCKVHYRHLSPKNMLYVIDTSSANITVSKDANDSIVLLNLGGQILKAKLINTALHAYPSGGHYGGQFFATDSIKLSFTASMASSFHYLGRKL